MNIIGFDKFQEYAKEIGDFNYEYDGYVIKTIFYPDVSLYCVYMITSSGFIVLRYHESFYLYKWLPTAHLDRVVTLSEYGRNGFTARTQVNAGYCKHPADIIIWNKFTLLGMGLLCGSNMVSDQLHSITIDIKEDVTDIIKIITEYCGDFAYKCADGEYNLKPLNYNKYPSLLYGHSYAKLYGRSDTNYCVAIIAEKTYFFQSME